jgi:hypothetical protein
MNLEFVTPLKVFETTATPEPFDPIVVSYRNLRKRAGGLTVWTT